MAVDRNPDFRVNVYGNDPNRVEDVSRNMALGGPRGGGGGGLPWFGGPKPSPTFPTTYANPSNPPQWDVRDEGPMPGDRAAGAGAAGGLFAGLSPRDIAAILTALTGVIGGAVTGRGQNTISTATTDPQLQALLKSMQGRLDKSEPLYDSIMAMANSYLPTQFQNPNASAAQPARAAQPFENLVRFGANAHGLGSEYKPG